MKRKNLSMLSIILICFLSIIIGMLITICGGFAWIYNTPNIRQAFVETYKKSFTTLSVEENLGNILTGTVEINIPLFFLELSEEPFDYKLTEKDKENGFTNIKKNADGSATYTIRKKEYEKFIEEYKEQIKNMLDELTSDDTFDSIERIEYTDNFNKITIYANKEKFESGLDSMCVSTCGLASCMYQMFDINSSGKCTVEVKDSKTDEVFQTSIYPDTMQNKP